MVVLILFAASKHLVVDGEIDLKTEIKHVANSFETICVNDGWCQYLCI